MSEAFTSTVTDVKSIVVPFVHKKIILPNVSIAEILLEAKFLPKESTTAFLGDMQWRGQVVPVFDYEGLDKPKEPYFYDRIVVMHGLYQPSLPYWAMVTQTMPRLLRVTSQDIQKHDETGKSTFETCRVHCRGEVAYIPDLETLEATLVSLVES